MQSFSSKIYKIGINPYVIPPSSVLKDLFKQSGKDRGPIPIRGRLNGHAFTQTLVKYAGKWRLYLNTPMRRAAGIDVGDMAGFEIEFDPTERVIPVHSKLKAAINKNEIAKTAFEKLSPYRQKEIIRYINNLRTEESVEKNITKVIQHLLGKQRFAGRD